MILSNENDCFLLERITEPLSPLGDLTAFTRDPNGALARADNARDHD